VITACFHGGPWDGLTLQLSVGYSCFCFQAHRPKDPVTGLPTMGLYGHLLPGGVKVEYYAARQAIGTRICYAHVGQQWTGQVPR
jgi:hypothetical protein